MAIPTILICGNEALLLDTRRLVLERARFRVRIAPAVADALADLANETLALRILCHTLERKQRDALMTAAAHHAPPVQTLSFCMDRKGDGVTGEYIHSLAGPTGLIAAVHRVLG